MYCASPTSFALSSSDLSLPVLKGHIETIWRPVITTDNRTQTKLLIITADRPDKLRKTGANQTTNQVNLYQSIPTHDFAVAIDIAHLLDGGPIHLNPQFEEPLITEDKIDWLQGLHVNPLSHKRESVAKLEVSTGVLVIGHDRVGSMKL